MFYILFVIYCFLFACWLAGGWLLLSIMPRCNHVGSKVRRNGKNCSLRNTVGTVIEMRDDIKSVVVQWSNLDGNPQTLHKSKLTVVNGNKPLTVTQRMVS